MRQDSKYEVALVIPVFNEEFRINKKEIENSFKRLRNVKLIFVNDGSTDGTQMVLSDLAKCFSRNEIVILENESNLGKAESIRRGFIRALQFNCSYIGFTDGDFATPPDEVVRLIEIIKETRPLALFGVRRNENGNEIETSRYREVQGTIFNLLAKRIIGVNLKDPQCGTKFFSNTSSLKAAIAFEFLNPWLFDLEIYLRLKKHVSSFEVDEITLSSWKHQPSSKVKFKDPFLMLINLFRLRRTYLESK